MRLKVTLEFAKQFSKTWAEDWNAHDLEKILSHYADDVAIESPLALKRLPQTNGVVVGKENVRKYWAIGLQSNTDLHFEIIDLLIGINSITIYYSNTATGARVAEVMIFDSNRKVKRAIVTYSQ